MNDDANRPQRNGRVIVYCELGLRSLLAAETLKRMGYGDVSSMAGGIRDWIAQGFSVE